MNMNKVYNCYEENCPDRLTMQEWKQYYNQEIDKVEYPDFATWFADMVRCFLLTEEK